MKAVYTLPLKLWLPLFVAVVFIALLAIIAWAERRDMRSELVSSSLRLATQDMTLLQREINQSFSTDQFGRAKEALTARGVNENYESLAAIDHEGRILVATQFALKGRRASENLPGFDPGRFAAARRNNRADVRLNPDGDSISAYFPLTLAREPGEIRPSRVGAIYLTVDLASDLAQIGRRVALSKLPMGLLLLGAMILLIGFMRLYVTRPIQRLVSAAEAIARDEPGAISRIGGSGELATLGAALNDMNRRLKERAAVVVESERRYRALFERSRDAIMILDPAAMEFTSCNPAALEMFGVKDEETFQALSLAELSAEKQPDGRSSSEKAGEMIQAALKNGSHYFSWTHRRCNGEEFPSTVLLSRTEWGGKVRVQGTVRDVTEEVQREEQSRQAQKMEALGQLAGGVAHDFNNILGSTMMNLELLLETPRLDDETREGLEELTADSERAAALVRQLLLYSRKSVMDVKVVSLDDTAARMLKLLNRVLGEHVKLTFKPESDLPPIEADEGMMEQVVMNLCVNARDAMPDGGRIGIAI